ncbi:MAG: glycosyltransferase [Pyrinomonadaceae bacterium]
MHLDVVIPTYNRQALLPLTLQSLLQAPVPAGMQVDVTVVDNNSSDNTAEVVNNWNDRFSNHLHYVFEPKQGRSHALNTGIRSTFGELVGFIDDDEEIAVDWFKCVSQAFSTMDVDFIGGPYIPKWEIEAPRWLPKKYCGVIGWIDGGNKIVPYGDSYSGILMGGNAVLSRAILEKVGLYRTSLSRNGEKLLAGEDDDMYRRLLAAGAKGLYLPNLEIFHFIPATRLTKTYHRRWCFWRGVSQGMLDHVRPESAKYLLGVPRYLYGDAARGLWANIKAFTDKNNNPAEYFSNELAAWDLFGFFYGKHFYYSKIESDSSFALDES